MDFWDCPNRAGTFSMMLSSDELGELFAKGHLTFSAQLAGRLIAVVVVGVVGGIPFSRS